MFAKFDPNPNFQLVFFSKFTRSFVFIIRELIFLFVSIGLLIIADSQNILTIIIKWILLISFLINSFSRWHNSYYNIISSKSIRSDDVELHKPIHDVKFYDSIKWYHYMIYSFFVFSLKDNCRYKSRSNQTNENENIENEV
jgi:hypothetical protein